MKIKVNYDKDTATSSNVFSRITLSAWENGEILFTEGVSSSIDTRISKYNSRDSIKHDLLVLSVIVYCCDRMVQRKMHSIDGWTREMTLEGIPAVNSKQMNRNSAEIGECLSYLTGDVWSVTFDNILKSNDDKQVAMSDNSWKVCLFSGGLDSLIGAIDILHDTKAKVILSSHTERGERLLQDTLVNRLGAVYPNRITHIKSQITLGRRSDEHFKKETSTRSRSFMFIMLALMVTQSTATSVASIVIPENGTISLNYPLSKSRRGSCSTRTTNPMFIDKLEKLFQQLKICVRLENPYLYQTKGEMIQSVKNKVLLTEIYGLSCSCAKSHHKMWWDDRQSSHCGKCLPCMYRRIALHTGGIDEDSEKYGVNVFTSHRIDIGNLNQASSSDYRALLRFIKAVPSKKDIILELLMNGIDDYHHVQNHARTLLRSWDQAKSWIQSHKPSHLD